MPFSSLFNLPLFPLSQAKHLQMVSGLDGFTYWIANFCWDAINYLLVFVCIIIIFAAFDLSAFGGENLGTVAIMMVSGHCLKLTVKNGS